MLPDNLGNQPHIVVLLSFLTHKIRRLVRRNSYSFVSNASFDPAARAIEDPGLRLGAANGACG
jgi:hypothetical protein